MLLLLEEKLVFLGCRDLISENNVCIRNPFCIIPHRSGAPNTQHQRLYKREVYLRSYVAGRFADTNTTLFSYSSSSRTACFTFPVSIKFVKRFVSSSSLIFEWSCLYTHHIHVYELWGKNEKNGHENSVFVNDHLFYFGNTLYRVAQKKRNII